MNRALRLLLTGWKAHRRPKGCLQMAKNRMLEKSILRIQWSKLSNMSVKEVKAGSLDFNSHS